MKTLYLVLAALSCIHAASSSEHLDLNDLKEAYQDSLPTSGVVVMVGHEDGSHDSIAIGMASVDEPLTTRHRFCIASVTKTYTATAVFMLQERQFIDVDDYVLEHLPFKSDALDSVTVKQLLNHTSGLEELLGVDELNKALFYPFEDRPDSMYISKLSRTRAAGKSFEYSSTNYFVLRCMIEYVTDMPFEAVIESWILKPNDLDETLTYYSNSTSDLAHAMFKDEDYHGAPKSGVNTISRGDGNFVASARDLSDFLRRLFIDRSILADSSLAEMTDFQTQGKTDYGCGVFQVHHGGKTYWGHTGRTFSYITYAFADPENGVTAVLLCNDANGEIVDRMFEQMFERMLVGE